MHPNYSFDRFLGANAGEVQFKGFTNPAAPKPAIITTKAPGANVGFTVSVPKAPRRVTYSYGEDLTTPVTLPGGGQSASTAGTGIVGSIKTPTLLPPVTATPVTHPKPTTTAAAAAAKKNKISTLGWIAIATATLIVSYAIFKPKPKRRRPRRR